MSCCRFVVVFFFKQKTAYEMRISDWSSDVCSSDLALAYALRCIQLEPWNEAGHRQHMRLLAYKGQHGSAQTFYAVYRNKLERDLNVEPEDSTPALFESIH